MMIIDGVPSRYSSTAPDRVRLYAVGDVHGRLDLLRLILSALRVDAARAQARGLRPVAVFLGDYVDRGPESRGVLDLLSRLAVGSEVGVGFDGIVWRFLEGNHEAAMRAFLTAPERNGGWLRSGGDATLASFGVSVPSTATAAGLRAAARALEAALTIGHRNFLDRLDLYVEHGPYVFVHAGIRPGVNLARQSRRDLLTIRDPFLSSVHPLSGRTVVHGHTPVDEPDLRAGRIAIDTGACATGILTCLVIEGDRVAAMATGADGTVTWRPLVSGTGIPLRASGAF